MVLKNDIQHRKGDGDGRFNENDPDTETVEVAVTSLDTVYANTGILPSFIKFDIEGSEKAALLGAAKIIRTSKPKLAICAYHKNEDYYVLPQTILSLNPDYKLYLRHYSNSTHRESVIYAI